MKRMRGIIAAVAVLGACGAAGAQTAVYKCGDGSYSDRNCSSRVVRTYEAPVPPSARSGSGVYRQLPGETVAEFNLRKRRGHLKETDRDECARLDKRVAFEQERTRSTAADEAEGGQAALDASRRRYRQIGC